MLMPSSSGDTDGKGNSRYHVHWERFCSHDGVEPETNDDAKLHARGS